MSLSAPGYWRSKNLVAFLWLPIALLFAVATTIRRWGYRNGLLKSYKLSVPVVVVGNITAGGAGKTPLVIALVEHLQHAGNIVGVVSGGYGGSHRSGPPLMVTADSSPHVAGDEPVLIAQRTGAAVVVAKDRVAAAKKLVDHCDVIICDDGLQHYALQRDIEIAVVDSQTLLGNEFLLPAGPLRESKKRLNAVDLVVHSGTHRQQPGYELIPGALVNLKSGTEIALSDLSNQQVHAVAAIAYPHKFYALLESHGLSVIEHSFPDHHVFSADELSFNDGYPVLMTEKDKVKCQQFAEDTMWYLPVNAIVDNSMMNTFNDLLTSAGVNSAGGTMSGE